MAIMEKNTRPTAKDKGKGKGKEQMRRQKIILSCTECRRRKIKCDHTKPLCLNCQKKHLPCSYATSPWINIIAEENKVYENIDLLKAQNEELMGLVESLNRNVIMTFNRNYNLDDDSQDTHDSMDYHFLKDSVEIPLRARVSKFLQDDEMLLDQTQTVLNVPYAKLMTTFKVHDPSLKNYFLDNLLHILPDVDTMRYHLNYYFLTNFHKQLPFLSPPLLFLWFETLFQQPGVIHMEPTRECENFIELSIIILALKICSMYSNTVLTDPQNILLRNAYISSEIGEIKTRSSLTTLQLTLLITSIRLFAHKVPDLDLQFNLQSCRDLAIALGIHKNTELIYEPRSEDERKVLQKIKDILSGVS